MEQIFEEQNFSEDKLHEECGVFGIFSHNEDVALNTYWGLYALQHRGQESTGIVVTDGERMKIKKGMGLVADVFKDGVADLQGYAGKRRFPWNRKKAGCDQGPQKTGRKTG